MTEKQEYCYNQLKIDGVDTDVEMIPNDSKINVECIGCIGFKNYLCQRYVTKSE